MKLMIIGEFSSQVATAAKIAMARGAQVNHVETIDQALCVLRKGQGVDLVFIDIQLDIKTLKTALDQERFSIPIIACGIDTDPDLAANAIRGGAREFIPFPPDPDFIAVILETMTKSEETFIYRDPLMRRIVSVADRIAPSDANVLITGESGTGKEVIARHVHLKSARSQKAFVSVNCAAIPENLLESELFGHEKGAFTGAIARRIGKFEEANQGTLLLDEISEMHPRLQAKLLRAIQEKVIDRVGGQKPIPVNIRIIATSNRDLRHSCQSGDFREDLYYRLNVVNLHLPPLRERILDIEALTTHFLKKLTDLNQMGEMKVSPHAMNALLKHPWKGNVRELQNVLHRAILLAPSQTIEVTDLFDQLSPPPSQKDPLLSPEEPFIGHTIATVEKKLILKTLDHCEGNKTHAATILGISIRTLRNKLHEYESQTFMSKENVKIAV